MDDIFQVYSNELKRLSSSSSTTEATYYPSIKTLLSAMLAHERLPFEVRTATSESRAGGGHDQPDFAFYDGQGDYVVVCGEVKLPSQEIEEIAFSEDRNDQVGRYLAQSGVVLVSNLRAFGLVTVRRGASRRTNIAPKDRVLEHTVELWSSRSRMEDGKPIQQEAVEGLYLLVETAVTRYAPIAEPESLAKILARQARRAKTQLPAQFTQAVSSLADDFGKALGVSFEGEDGEEFFRSSLVQTIFYGLFAGWTLWVRSGSKKPFRWEDLSEHLQIPFLGELYYEFQHPRRIQELGLRPHLELATETLNRVDQTAFFRRFQLPSIIATQDTSGGHDASAAILYFYEPFLEAFDPELRKNLGVWYTPIEVVHYQVRTVDRLLREKLGCERGFADDKVVVLDPCCGTGAYLIEVMRCIAQQLRAEGNDALVGQLLLDAATKRLLGFEILTAPFVIAQLQMFLILSGLGAKPTAEHRPAVFLTNSLTGWDGPEQMKLHFPELQAEYDAAQTVKRQSKIIVVLGNPPYNRFAGVPLAEEADLVDHYKGMRRDNKGRQIGPSELYAKWGIRKQLLDDLYIRFFRLAERCIGERAEYGVVSFISNYGFYAGRSHPIMRESLLHSFDEIWVDCLNGDKYKTGKVIPKGLPGEGTSDQSIFTTEHDSRGIQVGTGITTLLKMPRRTGLAVVHYRNFWGKSLAKRQALVASLGTDFRAPSKKRGLPSTQDTIDAYHEFHPTEEARWKFVPFVAQGGFEDWPAVDELFPLKIQGINPNRGLQGSVVDMDRNLLVRRMKDYFSDLPEQELNERYPVLMESRARYDPAQVRTNLIAVSAFNPERVVPYLVFPFDMRWLYYETREKFLNEARAELFENLQSNEFLVTVPEPRKQSETRPVLVTTAFDLHLHDRGSVSFPAEVRLGPQDKHPLFSKPAGPQAREANLHASLWNALKERWRLQGDLRGKDAFWLARSLVRICLAICNAPLYESEHEESIAQDWAHIPIPKDRQLFDKLVDAGNSVGILLNPQADAAKLLKQILAGSAKDLAVPTKAAGGGVSETDLRVEFAFFGLAQGGWRSRIPSPGEAACPQWGNSTGDLYLNNEMYFRNVPENVWKYELGGYPVIKKWLGYRDRGHRPGIPLSTQEASHVREMTHRLAALLLLHPTLSDLYEATIQDAFSAEELGIV